MLKFLLLLLLSLPCFANGSAGRIHHPKWALPIHVQVEDEVPHEYRAILFELLEVVFSLMNETPVTQGPNLFEWPHKEGEALSDKALYIVFTEAAEFGAYLEGVPEGTPQISFGRYGKQATPPFRFFSLIDYESILMWDRDPRSQVRELVNLTLSIANIALHTQGWLHAKTPKEVQPTRDLDLAQGRVDFLARLLHARKLAELELALADTGVSIREEFTKALEREKSVLKMIANPLLHPSCGKLLN